MTKFLTSLLFLACAISVESFTAPLPTSRISTVVNAEGDSEGLILDTEQVQQQMAKMRSKYPTAEADYLAAARKRAEMKVESNNNASTDDDWKQAAAEKKKQMGDKAGVDTDGWEASLSEAGNQDSQILIPMDIPDGSEGEDGPEPTLLL